MEGLSLSLYRHMCKYVVGTENHVKTIRLMNTICDNLSSDDIKVIITSGSFGEGLQMIGSDLDLMFVLKDIEVHDSRTPIAFSRSKTNFSMMTEGTKPGFVMLQLIGSPHPLFCEKCRMDNYLSNVLFKQTFLNELGPFVHGPCISDIHGLYDMAPSLHSKSWFKPASGWIVRSNSAWPDENTKRMIIDHGMLFVPIGAKGSPHEEFEWRISFSIAEKLLIYTFSLTQLLCYALMKILLKDVINTDSRCTNLLCSYYLKTIIFWISEEIQPSAWTPANLIPCFMRCFRRLIYCVQYQVCPHYFIPENNLFENKIEGLDRTNLIHTLHVLFSYRWRCLLFSKQISHVSILRCNVQNDHSEIYYEDIHKLLNSNVIVRVGSISGKYKTLSMAVHNSMSYNSKELKYLYAYFMSIMCNKHCQSVYLNRTISNKNQYKQYKTCLSYLLMNINHDTVSGWLMLTSFFYKTNQYKKSLIIISYALSKCTPEKLFRGAEMSVIQRLIVKWHFVQKLGMVHLLKKVLVDYVIFKTSTFIPKELLIERTVIAIPPVVYAHFLSFLCHYHLKNVQKYRNSIRDLQLTIDEDYFIGEDVIVRSSSYYCLGTALQFMGDNVSAKRAFSETVKLLSSLPLLIRRLKRLFMIASL